MTGPINPTPPGSTANIEELDLTPDGLDDAPAHQMDLDSIVYPGNS